MQAPAQQKGPRQCNNGNGVASLAKGGKVVRKGNLATKRDYDKTASWGTRKICQGLQVCHDGEVAKKANLSKMAALPRMVTLPRKAGLPSRATLQLGVNLPRKAM